MRRNHLAGVAAAIALSGCAAGYPVGNAIIVGVSVADAVQYYSVDPDGRSAARRAPDPDPTRKINAQDCTRPIDPDAGNLLCR
jgi:hypothetical protein